MPSLENWDGGLKSLAHVHVHGGVLDKLCIFPADES